MLLRVAALKPLPSEAKQMKTMKEYRDYGEYLEDACEQQSLKEMHKHGDVYIYGNKKLTITEKNGELKAEWETI